MAGINVPTMADYYGVTYAGYLVNGDYSDTSTNGTDIPGVFGEQLEHAIPTNNLFKGYANLNTGEMKSYLRSTITRETTGMPMAMYRIISKTTLPLPEEILAILSKSF